MHDIFVTSARQKGGRTIVVIDDEGSATVVPRRKPEWVTTETLLGMLNQRTGHMAAYHRESRRVRWRRAIACRDHCNSAFCQTAANRQEFGQKDKMAPEIVAC
jgi:hypothetical protein